ncbi:MAG TPA: hypothetical protein VFP31_11245, partial [Gaiellaceae bacterium]|nr:hypothetical protein [Gaiellaceae bacterium]
RREELRVELDATEAETYVVELKAAAVDAVVEHARSRGARVVLLDNEVVAPGLDDELLALADAAVKEGVPA